MFNNSRLRLASLILTLALVTSISLAETGRVELRKPLPNFQESQFEQESSESRLGTRVHPAQSLFPKRSATPEKTRSANFNRLLVLLVDFQEDDNPKTTGNGKFVLEFDPDYPITLGAPPRDYDYFDWHLQAMRYYYLAASLGSYNLEYDIYPKKNSPFFAYTLPNEMAYYNPGMNDTELFIARVEQYFQDIFSVADSYGDIDFSQYGHFLFIHAGSDWQHDVYGDTPSDLPSFFITVGEGKEAVVNDGTVKIYSAANVPETISQDDRYGVINAVLFHEFGHSLGFVDLYNVRNFYPGVGYWDIMDSGGATKVLLEGNDGELYAIEGTIPALPSAWHRSLVWKDYYKDKGFYKDIRDYNQEELITVIAASSKPTFGQVNPYIIRVPLNNKEYLLIENRHVDPDGDGGIAIKGAYPLTPNGTDYRVILYPTTIADDNDLPTYEYDWLLPGWINRRGESFGGGIIVWHIDESILYDEGVILSDGSFRSNYQNNSVNTDYYNRAVKIIEADNIKDIGNPYSWFWYGTEYEPYFRYKPELDQDGFFSRWSVVEYNRTLSATSKPALKTNDGYPSLYSIYDISANARNMSFRYRFEPFLSSRNISSNLNSIGIGTPGKSAFPTISTVLPVFTEEGFHLLRFTDYEQWEDFFGLTELDYKLSFPISTFPNYNGFTTFLVPSEDKLIFVEEHGLDVVIDSIEFGSDLVGTPVVVPIDEELLLIIPTEDEIIISDEKTKAVIKRLPFPNANLAFDGEILYVVSNGHISRHRLSEIAFDAQNRTNKSKNPTRYNIERDNSTDQIRSFNFSIPQYDSNYTPVVYKDKSNPEYDALFIQNQDGDIYILRNNSLHKFFTLSTYTDQKPSQIALMMSSESRLSPQQQSIVQLVFTAGEYLFAVDITGTLVTGYPIYLEGNNFTPYSYPRLVISDDSSIYSLLEVEEQGYLTFNHTTRKLIPHLSIIWDKSISNDVLYWNKERGDLSFFFSDNGGNIYESKLLQGLTENPITWNGYLNNGWALFEGIHYTPSPIDIKLTAFAYPNPVKGNEARVKIIGSEESINIKLFDISGKLVLEEKLTGIINREQDFLINTSRLSSGSYFGIVESKGNRTQFNLAIIK